MAQVGTFEITFFKCRPLYDPVTFTRNETVMINFFFVQITIQDISSKTSMHPQDIALTLMLLSFIRKNNNNKFILAVDWVRVDQHMQRVAASLANKTRYIGISVYFFLIPIHGQ